MRKVILFMMTTLDGFYEGRDRDINWHNVDAEFNEFAIAQLNTADILLFGRVTYELMASYWPTPDAIKNDPIVAEKMNSLHKIVFSKTLEKVNWSNTRLVKGNIGAEIMKMKSQPGKDMIIFGSSDLAVSLIHYNLIDEIRIMVNPVVLSQGKALFKGLNHHLALKLLNTRTFHSGNVLLSYEPLNK